MTVEISYYASLSTSGQPLAGDPGRDGTSAEAESKSISSSASLSAATPDGQAAVSLIGTEAFRYEYSLDGATTVVANSNYVASGERIWLTPRARYKFSLRTA